jgi:hypothetical protein
MNRRTPKIGMAIMDQEVIKRELENEERPRRRWPSALTWPVLLALGWILLYELPNHPGIGIAAICVKFGWEDFHTGFWLWRTDYHRGRGSACFWLYLAAGLWNAAIAATIMIFAFAFLAGLRQPAPRVPGQPNGPPPHVIGALLMAFIGFGLSALSTGLAIVLALGHRLKLWIDSGVNQARRDNLWPPPDLPRGRRNRVGWLMGTALILTVVPAVIILLLILSVHPGMQRGPNQSWLPILLTMSLIGVPIFVLVLRDLLHRRVVAGSPSECWGTDAFDPHAGWADAPEHDGNRGRLGHRPQNGDAP